MGPLVREVLLPERQPQNVDALLESLAGLVLVDAQVAVLARRAAAPDTDVDPTATQHVVEHAELFGDPERVVPRKDDDAHTHFESLGPPRHVIEDRERIARHVVRRAVMLHLEQRVEPQWFEEIGDMNVVLVDLPVPYGRRSARIRGVGVEPIAALEPEEHAELHPFISPSCIVRISFCTLRSVTPAPAPE